MKFGRRLKIAFDMLISRNRKFVFGIITLFAVFVMFGFVLILAGCDKAYGKRIEQGLKCNPENVYYLNYGFADNKSMLGEIQKLPGISALGSVRCGCTNTCECLSFLNEIQKGHFKFVMDGENSSGNFVETYLITDGFWKMANLKLSSGKEPSEYIFEDNTVLLYLSEEYKDAVSVGEHFYDKTEEGVIVYDYTVAGFLDKDSKIIPEGTGVYSGDLINCGYYTTEYAVIEVFQKYFSDAYVCIDKNNFEETSRRIYEIGDKYDTEIEIYSLANVVGYTQNTNTGISKAITEIAGLLLTAAVIFLISVEVGKIIMKSNDYGIWLVNGFTIKDVYWVIFYQCIIYILIPLTAAGITVYCFIMKEYGDIIENGRLIREIFFKNTLPVMLSIAAAITLIITLIPFMIIRRRNAPQILKGDIG